MKKEGEGVLKPPDDDYNGDNDENTVQLVEGGPQAPQTIMTQAARVLDYPKGEAGMNVLCNRCQLVATSKMLKIILKKHLSDTVNIHDIL